MRARARAILRELNFDLRPNYKVSQLSRAHQQMVEIAKAFLTEVRLLILDEPTASLTDAEAAKLFDLVAKLKASGVGIIYVSHRMREIKQIADRITVLRDGHKIKTVAAADVSSLLLARTISRQPEFAVRTALGASPLRVIRLVVAESLILSAGGGDCLHHQLPHQVFPSRIRQQ